MQKNIHNYCIIVIINHLSSTKNIDLKPVGISRCISNKPVKKNIFIYFRLCGNGSFKTKDLLDDFIIEEYKDKTCKEIYENILTTVTSMYKSPKDVINKIDNKMITVDGFIEYAGYRKSDIGERKVSISYRLQFDFKDNKIRIKAPIITNVYENSKSIDDFSMYTKEILWDKSKDTINEIQDNINNVIGIIILKSKTVQNDW